MKEGYINVYKDGSVSTEIRQSVENAIDASAYGGSASLVLKITTGKKIKVEIVHVYPR